LIESSGARVVTSGTGVKLCDDMPASEAPARGHSTSPDTSGDLYADAVRGFALIHDALAEVGEGDVLSRSGRRKFWEAIESARDRLGSVEGKRAQMEASARPLTVCFGRRAHRRIPELKLLVDAEISWGTFGDGCGVIFADSVTDSRPVFARYCPVCREKSERRRRNEIVARVAAAAEGRVRVPGGWRLTCRGCGERFSAPTPRRRRCPQCRH
jgi:hypothetical protein